MARLDTLSAQIALRTRALTLEVCTTGSTTLGTSAEGFTRTTGSFIADGFFPGMEVTPSGFPFTARAVVTDVSASLLKVRGGLTATSAASGRTLAVGIPETRGFENRTTVQSSDLAPYIEEEYVPRPPIRVTAPAQGATLREFGLWVVRWYGLPGYDVGAIRRSVDAFLALFAPGTTLTAGDHTLRVDGGPAEPGPFAGQLLRSGSHMVVTINVPVSAYTTNSIAA